MTEQETRIVTVTVDRVEDDNSKERDGMMNWKTYAFIPELGIKQYPAVLWISGDRPTKGTTLKANLRKGNLKKGKDGQYDNNYFWDVVNWDVQDGAPATATGKRYNASGVAASAAVSAPSDPVRASIEAQVALKAAVEMVGSQHGLTVEDAITDVTSYAGAFYRAIQDVQIIQADAPQPAAQPQNQAKGTETPGEIIKLPNQVSVADVMDGGAFGKAATVVGWDREKISGYLGTNAIEWTEKNADDGNLRAAWDFCVAAWETEQDPREQMPW